MSNSVYSMSPIYQIAYNLGARIEIQVEDSEVWHNSSKYIGLAHGTKYRVNPQDKALYELAKEIFLQTHTKVKFYDYSYYVPNNAIKVGTPVLFYYGLGVYAIVNPDLTITHLENQKQASAESEKGNFAPYLALSKKMVFDKNSED